MGNIEGPQGGRGKWSQPGVPHKGWVCEGMEDLGEPSRTCEMCEALTIRYVHYMRHPCWPVTLGCGQVCAGHMAEDLIGAKQRDKSMKDIARKRGNFPNRKAWRHNAKGNMQLNFGQYIVTIFPALPNRWKASVAERGKPKPTYTQALPTVIDAQLAAFDLLARLNPNMRL
jgi:hypothetical protein